MRPAPDQLVRSFDQDTIKRAGAFLQTTERIDEIAADGAAEAAIVEFDELSLFVVDHQLAIDTDLAELVDDNGQFPAMLLTQDTIDKRRLARPRKPVTTVAGIRLSMGPLIVRLLMSA